MLIVGMGAPGGVGRYERLLTLALTRPIDCRRVDLRTIWRSGHPSYLTAASARAATAAQGRQSSVRTVREIVDACVRWRPHIVLYTHVNLARAGLLLPPLPNRPLTVICAHGIEVWEALGGLTHRALRRATKVVTTTPYTANFLVEKHGLRPDRVTCLPLALEPPWYEERAMRVGDGSRILTVSRLDSSDRYKGVDRVIRALPQIRSAVPNVKLIVIGDGDDRPYLQQVAERLRVDDVVEWRRSVGHDELLAAYACCDVFALPSTGEGFGLVYLEAMAFGKPVIGWAARGTPHVVVQGETGFLVAAEEELASRITALLLDRNVRESMGANGRARLHDEFGFEAYRKRWCALVSELGYAS